MTSPRYYDVTHFLTDSNENCTAYVKLNSKIFLLVDFFLIFGIFIEKITIYYENPVYYTVTLHPSPIPFGQPIRVGSVRNTSFANLRILFQHKKTIVFTKNGENQGRSLSSPPIWWSSSTRSPLIFWDTFPPYLIMLFQQKTFFAIFDLNFG